jgi:sugar phosphate permease
MGGMIAARLGARLASPGLMALGLGLAAAGLLLTSTVLTQSIHGLLGAGMLLCGLGQGLFQVGYMDTTTTLLPAHERGVAGSLVNVTRGLGIVFGAAGISWLNGLWRNEAITFGLLGTGLALAALTFTMAVRRSRLAASL